MKVNLIHFLILFISSSNIAKSHLSNYCHVYCGNDNPVICRRQAEKCQLADACLNSTKAFHITMEQKHLIIHSHNKLRNQMALGLYNDLKATDMLELTWSKELEEMAQCWANTCNVKLDTCIRTLDNRAVGQNIILLNSTQLSRGPIVALQVALGIWFNERTLLQLGSNEINSYRGYQLRASNDFTQVIWANTRLVGCGGVLIGEKKNTYLVCNYLPAGNIPGKTIYSIGEEPCSQCPKIDNQTSECSYEWRSLCKTGYFKTRGFYNRYIRGNGYKFGVGSVFVCWMVFANIIVIVL